MNNDYVKGMLRSMSYKNILGSYDFEREKEKYKKKTSMDPEMKKIVRKHVVRKSTPRRKIIIIDPVTLQPLNLTKSSRSLGNYKKFEKPIVKKPSIKKISQSKKKVSKVDKNKDVMNKIAKIVNAVKVMKKSKVCPEGTKLNPKTGRCNKIKQALQKITAKEKKLLEKLNKKKSSPIKKRKFT